MKSINVNALVSCTASYCEAQVIGLYCKKIYRGFSGTIITGWHKIRHYETVTMLPACEHTVRYEQPSQLLNTSDNLL
jgi:hypothetical protein